MEETKTSYESVKAECEKRGWDVPLIGNPRARCASCGDEMDAKYLVFGRIADESQFCDCCEDKYSN